MKISPIIAQIQAECPSFTQVAGALTDDLEMAISQAKLPAAYVVRLDEDGEILEDMGNECYQEITEYFAVLVILNNQDPRAQQAADQLDDIRAELFKALLRWCPDAAHDKIEYTGGSLVTLTRDRLIYSYQFKTFTTVQKDDAWQQVAHERMGPFKGVDINVDEIGPREHKPDGTPEARIKIETQGA